MKTIRWQCILNSISLSSPEKKKHLVVGATDPSCLPSINVKARTCFFAFIFILFTLNIYVLWLAIYLLPFLSRVKAPARQTVALRDITKQNIYLAGFSFTNVCTHTHTHTHTHMYIYVHHHKQNTGSLFTIHPSLSALSLHPQPPL